MPESRKIRIASNTGPLLSAFQCQRTDLLRRYFEVIFVPPSVVAELDRLSSGADIQALIAEGLVVIEGLLSEEADRARALAERIARSPLTSDPAPANHLPEAEAMLLTMRRALGLKRLLLEERAARQVADEEGLTRTGFVGVLLLACEDRVLKPEDLRVLLDLCRQRGTHYSQSLVEYVCQLCEEFWK